MEGLSRCEWRETWVSMYRHQIKKKFSAAALMWKPLVGVWAEADLETTILYQSWSHFKVAEDKKSLLMEILQQKFFLWS